MLTLDTIYWGERQNDAAFALWRAVTKHFMCLSLFLCRMTWKKSYRRCATIPIDLSMDPPSARRRDGSRLLL